MLKVFDNVRKMTPFDCLIVFVEVQEKMLISHIKRIIYFEKLLFVACSFVSLNFYVTYYLFFYIPGQLIYT